MSADAPATSSPAESVPVVEAVPATPAPAVPRSELGSTTGEIEIEAAPSAPLQSGGQVELPAAVPPVTDKSSERFSATPPPSPSLDPALRQGPTPVSPAPALEPVSSPPPPQPVTDTSPDKTAVSSAANGVDIKSRLGQALEVLRFRKRAKLDKILAFAAKKKSIKNDDVEKLLKVSDATAQRYLNQLISEGKLRRVGHPKQPTYEPV